MDYVIVGTAGHVDHGKTVLVKALTGVNTDRLKEEQERGISIELGFAPLTLSNGQRIGLVDVPGHERFIKQMLAGVGGMDLVLLVVAADEGIMPQTREHLDIIDLLQIRQGIVVVTKKDLVDQDWLELVVEDIKEALQGTVLEGAPIYPVSALTGEGIPALKEGLERLVAQTAAKSPTGKVRLPVDRVFSITGFGTVVTGTLWSGQIQVGDVLEIQPQNLQVRVRNLEVHGQKVDTAKAGQRVAVNLAGVETSEISRGSTLLAPGTLSASYRIDIQLHLLKSAPEMEHRQRVRVHLGTAEVLGRVILLEGDTLAPGETAFAQLQLEEPLVADKQDRLVIRSYSPMRTIGGGQVIDPVAPKHRRFDPQTLERLATRLTGTPEELILEALQRAPVPVPGADLAKAVNLAQEELAGYLQDLKQAGQVMEFGCDGQEWYWPAAAEAALLAEVAKLLEQYHRKYPLRGGFPKEELRSRKFSKWPAKLFNGFIQYWEEQGHLVTAAGGVRLPAFEPTPSPKERQWMEGILAQFRRQLFQPPAWEEALQAVQCPREAGEELLHYLLDTQALVKGAEGLYFHREAVDRAKEVARELIKVNGSLQLGSMRDALGSSRKYVLALLEYLDQIKFTKRIGDVRILFSDKSE